MLEWILQQYSFDIKENIDGVHPKPTLYKDWQINKGYNRMTPKRYMKINEEATKETGIYIITIGWKKKVDIQRTFKGLLMALLII